MSKYTFDEKARVITSDLCPPNVSPFRPKTVEEIKAEKKKESFFQCFGRKKK